MSSLASTLAPGRAASSTPPNSTLLPKLDYSFPDYLCMARLSRIAGSVEKCNEEVFKSPGLSCLVGFVT